MIRMTRVRLINWHNFIDNIIEFKTISYMIGVNAVGKTTIMDAIRYCLTTNKDFNAAGNKKSGRTLQGSVHQKQRADDEYLRKGHTVSYIGIEFLDEAMQKRFTITARVESESPYQELRHVFQDWYISKPGYTLEDLPFFIEDKAGRRPSKREEFRLENRGLDRAASQADARRRICRQLGIGDSESNVGKKFNKVFHMGTSLEDILDIRKFIYTYILPEPEVNIEGLYRDMQELQNLQEVLEESRIRAEALARINEQLEKALEYDSRAKTYEVLLSYAQLQAMLAKRKELADSKAGEELIRKALETKICEIQAEHEEALQRWTDAKARLGSDENHQKMESLRRELEDQKRRYDDLKRQASEYDHIVSEFKKLVQDLFVQGILDPEGVALPLPENTDYTEKITAIQKEMGNHSETLSDQLGTLSVSIRRLEQECRYLSDEIRQLQNGRMVYPEECGIVLGAINDMFAERGIRDKAALLCELLYMNRPEWQDAVESYLNTQRFHVIVPPEQYWLAKQVFMSLGDKVKGIGLIDTVSLMRRQEKRQDGGLADILKLSGTVGTENPYARAYVDFRLGDVVCCSSADDLEKYPKSVTKDRLRYQGYVLQKMRKQTLYIGQDAIKKRLGQAVDELKDKQAEKSRCESGRTVLMELDGRYRTFMAGSAFTVLLTQHLARNHAETVFSEISVLDSRIKEMERNPLLQGMINREAECKDAFDRVDAVLLEKNTEKESINRRLEEICRKMCVLLGEIRKCEETYHAYQESHARYLPEMEKEYADLTRRQTPAEIIAISQSQGTLQRKINELNNFITGELIPLQRNYNAAYSLDYRTGLEGMEQYQSAYRSLIRIEIEKHQENLRLAQARCKERFRKEVLFRMKDDIERAKRLFRELNRVMGNLKYGEESYEFVIEGSRDKELQIFYNLIMDKENRQIREEPDLFSLPEGQAAEVFESQIEEFMQRIMVEVEQRSQQNLSGEKMTGHELSAYADYRTYLYYDILVKNAVTGKAALLSKVSGDGSGGENQAPFYVAICASLLQIYQQSDNCIQLVLLDEAFNNMTSDRIKPMMEMFRQLKLQLILIATPEKCTSIYPYCDVTYSIIKQGSRNAIASFEGVDESVR